MSAFSKIPYPKNDEPVKDHHSPAKSSSEKDAKKMETVKATDKFMKMNEAPKKKEMGAGAAGGKMAKPEKMPR